MSYIASASARHASSHASLPVCRPRLASRPAPIPPEYAWHVACMYMHACAKAHACKDKDGEKMETGDEDGETDTDRRWRQIEYGDRQYTGFPLWAWI